MKALLATGQLDRLLALALVALPAVTFALGKPIIAYTGSAGGVPIELLLIHDWQLDGMDGFFISSLQNRALPLEKVPYQSGDTLLGVILEPVDLPRSALQLMPFELGQHRLHGRLVDLRYVQGKTQLVLPASTRCPGTVFELNPASGLFEVPSQP